MSNRYARIAGAKGLDGTSQFGATEMGHCAARLRRAGLYELGEATVLKAVPFAQVTRASLQPRFAETRVLGPVEITRTGRPSASGKQAAVPRLTDKSRKAVGDE